MHVLQNRAKQQRQGRRKGACSHVGIGIVMQRHSMPSARRTVLHGDQYITGSHAPFLFPSYGWWHGFCGPALDLSMDERRRKTSRVVLDWYGAAPESTLAVSLYKIGSRSCSMSPIKEGKPLKPSGTTRDFWTGTITSGKKDWSLSQRRTSGRFRHEPEAPTWSYRKLRPGRHARGRRDG